MEGPLTLDRLWIEIQSLKRNKVDVGEYQKLIKRVGEGDEKIMTTRKEVKQLPGVVTTH